jgi:hypothetical protein
MRRRRVRERRQTPTLRFARPKDGQSLNDVPERFDVLGARLRAVHAAGRIADALLAVALDALEPYATEYLTPPDYQRLCRLVDGPVATSTDCALEALLEALATAIDASDPELVRRLEGLRADQILVLD